MTPRVLVLGPLPPPYGGPEVMTATLVNGLERSNGLSIKHLDTQVSRSLADKGGKRQLYKSLLGIRQMVRLIQLIVSFNPRVVYLPLTNSPSFMGFLRDCLFIVPALFFRKRVILRLHGGYYFYVHRTGVQAKIARAVLGRVHMAMVQGSRLTDEFNAYIPTERIVVIPNGVDERPFEAARARQTKTSPHAIPKHVLFVGLLVREKGFRDVIQAIPHVPQAQFVFAGEWPSDQDRVEVETFLKEHGVADRVTFTGVVSGDAKYALFVSAHLFVFPTYFVYEGHAVSSVEALAAGLPIVCTNHGALNESVREGWNGFFVPRADPTAVAMCINQLLQDEPLRQKMGARSRQLFLERFTLDTFINQWAAAVRTCAESPNLR